MQKELLNVLRNYKEKEYQKEKKRDEEQKELFDKLLLEIKLKDEMIEIKHEAHFRKIFSKKIILSTKISDKYNIYIDDTGYKDFYSIYYETLRDIRYVLEDKLTGELYGLFFLYKVTSIEFNSYTTHLFKVNEIDVCFFKVENINISSLEYDIEFLRSGNNCFKKALKSLRYRNLKKYLNETNITLKTSESNLTKKILNFNDINSYLTDVFIRKAYNSIISDTTNIYDETSTFAGMSIHVKAEKIVKDVLFEAFDGENYIGNFFIPSEVINVRFSISIPKKDNIVDSGYYYDIPKTFTTTLSDLIANK